MITYLTCMALAAALNDLPPRVLPAIQAVEGGRVGSIHRNANGTADLGVMQINTVWLPTLAAGLGQAPAELRQRLIGDPCFNIVIAGAILRLHLDEERGDLWRAIGDYHSRRPASNQGYQLKVGMAAIRQGLAVE
jgi:soluble lytic murein transglycosylase-like protein